MPRFQGTSAHRHFPGALPVSTAMHAPKIVTFDVAARVSVDNKGFVRTVERYETTPFGLYMSRPMVGRASAHWMRSWLLPALGLAVTDFSWNNCSTRSSS